LASVEAKYGQRVDGAEPTHVFAIEQELRPIGWIQWYLWADYRMRKNSERNLGRLVSTSQSENLI
jgi:hypothetical protein